LAKQIVKLCCQSERSLPIIAAIKNYEDGHKLRNIQAFRDLENDD
ncbi:19062_t:CDS:1, partial [Racocetra persica]